MIHTNTKSVFYKYYNFRPKSRLLQIENMVILVSKFKNNKNSKNKVYKILTKNMKYVI